MVNWTNFTNAKNSNSLCVSSNQLESVAECASRLRLLNKALDVSTLRLDVSEAPQRQELVRLQAAGLGLDVKESLLEACGLVLLANNQLDPHKSGELATSSTGFFLEMLKCVKKK